MKNALHEVIRRKRQAAGKTMRQAAFDLGVTERAYAAWEAGTSIPRPCHREKLGEYFGITVTSSVTAKG